MRKLVYALAALFMLPVALPAQQPFVDEFDVRCMYVDCRTQVMTMDAIKALALDISQRGMNAMLIEWEATFPFERNATACNQYAYTSDEVKDLVAYCATLGIDVIPLQNCFGHSEYILRHDRYAAIREDTKDPSQVCPLKIEEATSVFREIFAEVATLHPSQYFHIGADETYLLGDCRHCAEVAAKEGKSRLFVDYIKAMSEIVIEMGKTPVIWADIILMYPEAVEELPDELIFVDWNYGWEPDRFGKLENLFAAGVKMWGASALRSAPDNMYLTQWEKHFNNLAVFVPFARKSGYTGMIQTSWSTGGTYGFHYDMGYEIINMQPVRQVYPQAGFNMLIAATAKAYTSTEALDPHAFVAEYAQERYGLTAQESEVMWEYIAMPQEIVYARTGLDAKKRPIPEVLADCAALKVKLDALSPKSNKKEFEHYRLMLDMRINYLQYKEIETVYESASYDRSQAAGLTARLKLVVAESDRLSKRFVKLCRGYLKDGEIYHMDSYRSEKIKSLYGWLSNNQ